MLTDEDIIQRRIYLDPQANMPCLRFLLLPTTSPRGNTRKTRGRTLCAALFLLHLFSHFFRGVAALFVAPLTRSGCGVGLVHLALSAFGTELLKIVVRETAKTNIMCVRRWGEWGTTTLITLPTRWGNCWNQRGKHNHGKNHSGILSADCSCPSVLSVYFLKKVCQKHMDWHMRSSWFSGKCARVFCCLRLCFTLPFWTLIYSGRKDEREHFSLNNQSRCTL